jgi:hypothetical protein
MNIRSVSSDEERTTNGTAFSMLAEPAAFTLVAWSIGLRSAITDVITMFVLLNLLLIFGWRLRWKFSSASGSRYFYFDLSFSPRLQPVDEASFLRTLRTVSTVCSFVTWPQRAETETVGEDPSTFFTGLKPWCVKESRNSLTIRMKFTEIEQ